MITGHEVLSLPTDVQLAENLELLVRQQQEELESRPPLINRLGGDRAIFAWFKWFINTREFQETYRQAGRYLSTARTDEKVQSLKWNLKGWLFERIAFTCISKNLHQGLVLLPNESTFQFYQILFPKAPVQITPLDIKSLAGISVPDGLLVENISGEANILGVVEYSLKREKTYFEKKFSAFTIDKHKFPTLLGKSSLLFVTPTFGQQRLSLPPIWKAKIQELPFTHHQFRKFSTAVYGYYRPDQGIPSSEAAGLTLKEVQERARAQRVKLPETQFRN